MSELDRYLFKQLLGPFGFFALVFTGVLWLTQALRLFDTLISNGQSGTAFLEFSALVLPNVMVFVLPLSVFAASLYALNRLYMESELVVMLMSGRSPWSLVRPLLIFGASGMICLFVVTLYLVPQSQTRLEDRLLEIRNEITNSLIVEGQFGHPSNGITTFIRDTNADGDMGGIFIHDSRDISEPITYSANRAVLVNEGSDVRIVMFDGVMQSLSVDTENYSTISFERFAFDLSEFVPAAFQRPRKPTELSLFEALDPSEEQLAHRWSKGNFIANAHERIVTPLLALVLPLISLGAILAGSFKRGGLSIRMTMGVGLLIGVQILMVVTKSAVTSDWTLWPVAYLPILASLAISLILITVAASRHRPRRLPQEALA